MVKDDSLELVVPRFEWRLLVFLPEETRVGEARAHHAVSPFRDEVGPVCGVHHGDIARQELALAPCQRRTLHAEVALVPPRDGPDDGRRKGQEGGVERARDDVRLLDERRVLIDQHRLVVVRAAGRSRRVGDARHHDPDALGTVDQDVPLAESLHVAVGARQIEGAGRQKAVPARAPPATNAPRNGPVRPLPRRVPRATARGARTSRRGSPTASTS